MKSQGFRRWCTALVLAFSGSFAACASNLSEDLSGLPCDEQGRCASGYVCDIERNVCLRTSGEGAEPGGVACKEGETVCSGKCAVLARDAKNCGACGAKCAPPLQASATCSEGRCDYVCDDGFEDCDGTCSTWKAMPPIAAAADPLPSSSGRDRHLRARPMRRALHDGFTACGGECVDVTNDPEHCGGCGLRCPLGKVCSAGSCADTCQAGAQNCNGACANVTSSNAHCERATRAAQSRKTGRPCVARGACTVQCDSGFEACGTVCADTRSDTRHCGECDASCDEPLNASASCVAGACEVVCDRGFALCDSTCVDTSRDPENCGACGRRCAAGEACSAGSCASGCPDGSLDCGGTCTNVENDPSHCGSCDNSCPVPESGSAVCSGTCGILCNAELTACNGQCVNVRSSSSHCGRCDNVCGPSPTAR